MKSRREHRIDNVVASLLLVCTLPTLISTAFGSSPGEQAAPYVNALTAFHPAVDKFSPDIAAGSGATSFVLSSDGSTAYIARDQIAVVNTATGATEATIPGVYFPDAMTLSADGRLLYAIRSYTFETDTSVYVYAISTQTNAVVQYLTNLSFDYQPTAIAVTLDGSELYVNGSGALLVIDALSFAVKTTLSLHGGGGLAFSPGGKTLWVASLSASILAYAVDTASNTISGTIYAGSENYSQAIALNPSGNLLYVSTLSGLVIASTSSKTVVSVIPVSGLNGPLAVSANGEYVYEAGTLIPGLFQFDVAAGTVTTLLDGGEYMIGVQILPGHPEVHVLETSGIPT